MKKTKNGLLQGFKSKATRKKKRLKNKQYNFKLKILKKKFRKLMKLRRRLINKKKKKSFYKKQLTSPKNSVLLYKIIYRRLLLRRMLIKKNFTYSQKFVQLLMLKGKKNKATQLLFKALLNISKEMHLNAMFVLFRFLNQTKIPFRLLGVRVRGKSLGIPVFLKKQSQLFDAFKRLIIVSRNVDGISFNSALASVVVNSFNNQNKTVLNNLKGILQTAITNKRYIRYRW